VIPLARTLEMKNFFHDDSRMGFPSLYLNRESKRLLFARG
jgi:hypothetical protein